MRQKESLFNQVVEFINSKPVGESYKASELCIAIVGSTKDNISLRPRQYQRYLVRAGFLQHPKHAYYTVAKHIPDWFDYGHLSLLMCHYKYAPDQNKFIYTYKGLSREDIQKLLKSGLSPKEQEPVNKTVSQNIPVVQNEPVTSSNAVEIISPEQQLENENFLKELYKKANPNDPEEVSTKETSPQATSKMEELINLSENHGLVLSAISALSMCTVKDQFMRARIYNLTVLAQDIAKAISDRQESLLHS